MKETPLAACERQFVLQTVKEGLVIIIERVNIDQTIM